MEEKVSNFIKKIRKDNNLTQKDLAKKYGVTYQAVSKWENGINMPDMILLKKMSKDFNISLDDILEGKYKSKKNNKILIYIFLSLVIISLLIINIYNRKSSNFEFKTLTTTCDNFTITGSLSYNNKKSAIYISNIEYCGEDNNEVYKNIECNLYERHNDKITKISSNIYNKDKNITLEEYLKTLTFTIDNSECKEYKESELYLEINATDEKNKISHYKIPLKLIEACNN